MGNVVFDDIPNRAGFQTPCAPNSQPAVRRRMSCLNRWPNNLFRIPPALVPTNIARRITRENRVASRAMCPIRRVSGNELGMETKPMESNPTADQEPMAQIADNASLEIVSPIEPLGPLHRRLHELFGLFHEAVRLNERSTVASLVPRIEELLTAFEQSETEGGSNPPWRRTTLRASWAYCRQDYVAAKEFDLRGWDLACVEPESDGKRKRMSVSANNLGSISRMLGLFDDAVQWCVKAVDLWPKHPIWQFNYALALGLSGRRTEAGRIFGVLLRAAQFQSRKDILAACMEYEQDLRKLRGIPEVDQVLAVVAKARSERGDSSAAY